MEELKPKRMIFDANGEWVCWDEVKKNFESLTKENEELREASKTLLSLCDLEDENGRLVHKDADKEILRKLLTPKN